MISHSICLFRKIFLIGKQKISSKNFVYCNIFILLQLNDHHIMSKKVLYTLEFPVKCSPSILYDFLINPSGLQEWFADKVDERDGIYTFEWNGTGEKAELLEKEEDKFVRYRWMHYTKDEYFEFRIEKTEISNQTIFVIKDFADKKDIKDQSQLWEYQVKDLFHRLGN